jgi:hypothetical protein
MQIRHFCAVHISNGIAGKILWLTVQNRQISDELRSVFFVTVQYILPLLSISRPCVQQTLSLHLRLENIENQTMEIY